MFNVSAMQTNNPVLIGSAMLANVAISAAKPVLATAYATAAIACAIVSVTVMVLLPWLWRVIFASAKATWALRVPLALSAALVGVVVVAAMLPQVAVGVLLAVAFAVVTKP